MKVKSDGGLAATLRRRPGRALGVVAVVTAVAVGVVFYVLRSDDLPEGAAFRYQARVVTEKDLSDRVAVLEALYGVKRPTDPATARTFDRDAAKSMAVSLVLAHEAAKKDVVVSSKEAQTELDKLIDQQLTGGRAAFVEFLSTSGISERDVLDEIKSQIATSRLLADVTADVDPATAEQARRTYDQHRGQMVTPEGRRLVNIVVETRRDADRVVKLAEKSGKLAPLAATWSLDGSTRDKQGDLGLITKQQLDGPYADVAFRASKGEIFGPVRTSYGWNVGQVTEIVSAKHLRFKDVETQIRERITADARLKVWRKFFVSALKRADVTYAEAYRPKNPTSPPSATPTPPKHAESAQPSAPSATPDQ